MAAAATVRKRTEVAAPATRPRMGAFMTLESPLVVLPVVAIIDPSTTQLC